MRIVFLKNLMSSFSSQIMKSLEIDMLHAEEKKWL